MRYANDNIASSLEYFIRPPLKHKRTSSLFSKTPEYMQ